MKNLTVVHNVITNVQINPLLKDTREHIPVKNLIAVHSVITLVIIHLI